MPRCEIAYVPLAAKFQVIAIMAFLGLVSLSQSYSLTSRFVRRVYSSGSALRCTDFNLVPIDKKGIKGDSDTTWQKRPGAEKIVNIDHTPFTRPDLITFDAYNTLIMPSQGVGKWYREALNTVCDMKVRLPRPVFFAESFKKQYAKMDEAHPCFGATTGLTPEEWWYQVIKDTYLNTTYLSVISPDELEELMPDIFDLLYSEIFSTEKGWDVKEDVEYTLNKLKEWRDLGSGPKIGVVSNFDERLPRILDSLGIKDYFDVIMTSQECKSAKPDRVIFDEAMKSAGVSDPGSCYHIGDREDTDVAGAIAAGWRPMRYNEDFDEDFNDWDMVETAEQQDDPGHVTDRESVLKWGRRNSETGREWTEIWGLDDMLTLFGLPDDDEKLIPVTVTKGIYEDE